MLRAMRRAIALGLAALASVIDFGPAPAEAQSYFSRYPWCAQYNLPGGPVRCRYSTFEQCLPEVRGVGGQCVLNPYYGLAGPGVASPTQSHQRRGARHSRRR